MYSPVVLDHFGNPRNVGDPGGLRIVGLSGDPNAGPFMRIFLVVRDGLIQRACFETYGCIAAIAAGSLVTEWIAGMPVAEASLITTRELLNKLGGLPLGKENCAALAVEALGKALFAREVRGEE